MWEALTEFEAKNVWESQREMDFQKVWEAKTEVEAESCRRPRQTNHVLNN